MDEIDAVSDVLKNKLTKISNNKNSENARKGDMGEKFVKDAIKQSFFDRGYTNRTKGNGTFRIYKQFKSGNKGRGGIDFHITFTDDNGNTGECFIESKNWGDYSISNNTYKTEIKDRFDKVDPTNTSKRALAIPKTHKNNNNLKQRCSKDNITILPISEQITDVTLIGKNVKSTFEKLKKELDDYLDGFVPTLSNKTKDSISKDIIQGKDYKVVAKKWDKSIGHVRNIGTKLDIPNRKEKDWKTISYIIYKKV